MGRPLPRQQIVAVERLQALPHAAELCADRPPLRLARMGREHQLHREPVDQPLHLVGRRAGGSQRGDPGHERFPERLRMLLPLPFPQHAHPLAVFRDVREVEEDRKGPGDDPRLGDGEPLDPGGERPLGIRQPLAAVAGKPADLGHEGRRRGPRFFDDHGVELAIEQSDIPPQEFVIGQGIFSSMRWGGGMAGLQSIQHRRGKKRAKRGRNRGPGMNSLFLRGDGGRGGGAARGGCSTGGQAVPSERALRLAAGGGRPQVIATDPM